MVVDVVQLTFDYGSLDSDTRAFVQEKAHETRGLLKRASDEIIQIGQNLIEAKDRLPKGQFIPWVKAELGISQPTAWRFMQVAKGKQVKSFNMNEIVVLPPVEPGEGNLEVRYNRTNGDKRRAVENFFAEFPHLYALSNREIAKRCGVSELLVRNMRKELFPPAPRPEPVIESEPELSQPESQEDTTQEESKPEPKEEAKPLPKVEPSEEVKLARDIRRQEIEDRNEQLREKGAELPQGRYACIVIDPPWTMEKIEREERPNQLGFDYPTMTEDELKAFPLPDMTADNCHLYLWTTQKHLPLALRLAEHWGFKYQCLMTWVKNVGITPFTWMYSTEHILFCTKGNLPLLATGKRLDFSAKVREHSRKPDEFYDIVREVSPGPRLDIFSREGRDGFEQYGNEVGKYV
jgi:N6-adenosine-specific RNA methylase IME4